MEDHTEEELVEQHAAREDADADEGHRNVKHRHPKHPSQAEVSEHQPTHMPHRTWCPHCIKGRGKDMNRATQKVDGEPTVSEYHTDSCFPGEEMGERLTLLVSIEVMYGEVCCETSSGFNRSVRGQKPGHCPQD